MFNHLAATSVTTNIFVYHSWKSFKALNLSLCLISQLRYEALNQSLINLSAKSSVSLFVCTNTIVFCDLCISMNLCSNSYLLM